LLESGDFFPRQICFLRNNVGKAIKAILIFEEVYFPKSHDLDRLRDLIPEGWKVKEQFSDLAGLTAMSKVKAACSAHGSHFDRLNAPPSGWSNKSDLSAFHELRQKQTNKK
jgi:hypothetical protein